MHLFSEKPPKDHMKKIQYFREKQKFSHYQTSYGDSLKNGADQQKTIVVQKSGSKKKKGKKEKPKQVSFVRENIIEVSKS